jgi:hypothetical protein
VVIDQIYDPCGNRKRKSLPGSNARPSVPNNIIRRTASISRQKSCSIWARRNKSNRATNNFAVAAPTGNHNQVVSRMDHNITAAEAVLRFNY